MAAMICIGQGAIIESHRTPTHHRSWRRVVVCLFAAALSTLLGLRPAFSQAATAVATGAQASGEWYETGLWPLLGSVVVIVVSNAVAVWLVHLNSAASLRAVLKQRKIEQLSASLSEFYDPILALIEVNGAVFKFTGPPSFPDEHIEREVAAKVWAETKSKILENNKSMELVLTTKSHLMHRSDSLVEYQKLLLHVAMYDTFQRVVTDRYSEFQFPTPIVRHIMEKRHMVIAELNLAIEGVK